MSTRIQMLGLQLPPSDGGLQYVLHDGTWVEPVIANTDVVLCNVGRMLTSASNNRFRPSTHRVHRSTANTDYRTDVVGVVRTIHHTRPTVADAEDGLRCLEPTWGDFIANRFAALGAINRRSRRLSRISLGREAVESETVG